VLERACGCPLKFLWCVIATDALIPNAHMHLVCFGEDLCKINMMFGIAYVIACIAHMKDVLVHEEGAHDFCVYVSVSKTMKGAWYRFES